MHLVVFRRTTSSTTPRISDRVLRIKLDPNKVRRKMRHFSKYALFASHLSRSGGLATQPSSPTEALPPTDASPLTEALEMTSRICIGLRLEIRGRKGYALIKLKCRNCVLIHSHRKYVIVRSTYVLFGVA